eukprot:356802-Chlamydomonas_euryale.AAC.7
MRGVVSCHDLNCGAGPSGGRETNMVMRANAQRRERCRRMEGAWLGCFVARDGATCMRRTAVSAAAADVGFEHFEPPHCQDGGHQHGARVDGFYAGQWNETFPG